MSGCARRAPHNGAGILSAACECYCNAYRNYRCVYGGMMEKRKIERIGAFPSRRNVSEVKPRLGLCQFQQEMSIKNYAVLLSKVTALLLEPLGGFLPKLQGEKKRRHAELRCRAVISPFRLGIKKKFLQKLCPNDSSLPSVCARRCSIPP